MPQEQPDGQRGRRRTTTPPISGGAQYRGDASRRGRPRGPPAPPPTPHTPTRIAHAGGALGHQRGGQRQPRAQCPQPWAELAAAEEQFDAAQGRQSRDQVLVASMSATCARPRGQSSPPRSRPPPSPPPGRTSGRRTGRPPRSSRRRRGRPANAKRRRRPGGCGIRPSAISQ